MGPENSAQTCGRLYISKWPGGISTFALRKILLDPDLVEYNVATSGSGLKTGISDEIRRQHSITIPNCRAHVLSA